MSTTRKQMTGAEIAQVMRAFAEAHNKLFDFDYLMEGISGATAHVLETVPAPKRRESDPYAPMSVPPRREYAILAKHLQADLKRAVAAGDARLAAVLALHLAGKVVGFDIAIYRDILDGSKSAGIAWRGGFVKCNPGRVTRKVVECFVDRDSMSLSDLGLQVWNNRGVDKRTVDSTISKLKNRMMEGKCMCILSRDGDVVSVVPRKGRGG